MIKEIHNISDIRDSKDIILIKFGADWCNLSKEMNKELTSLIKEGYNIFNLDVEEHADIKRKYNVRGLPTCIIFKNGKEINRFMGVCSSTFIRNKIKG